MLTVWLSGDWQRLPDLRAALAANGELAVGGPAEAVDVVVHVAGDGTDDDLARIREHAHAPIVLLAAGETSRLLEATLDDETIDVLILPQPAEAVVFAARRAVVAASRRRTERPRGRVATVFSPKGGTGKSVVSCNLAVALARRGLRVLLVDLDLQFGDVAIMLGLQPQRTLFELLTAPGPVDVDKIAGYATRHSSGVEVLPAPLKPEDAESIGETRVAELLTAARAGYDAVVVDTSPFFHGAVLATVDHTDDLLMLCTPDVPTLKNVRLTLQTLDLLSFPADRVRVVLNRANARVGFRAKQIANVLERDVAFELPEDETVAIAVNRGRSAVEFKSESPFSVAVTGIAEGLVAPIERPAPRRASFLLGRRR